jgi:hypothetical protein
MHRFAAWRRRGPRRRPWVQSTAHRLAARTDAGPVGSRGRRRVELVAHRSAGRVGRGWLARSWRAGTWGLRPERRRRRARRPVDGGVHRGIRRALRREPRRRFGGRGGALGILLRRGPRTRRDRPTWSGHRTRSRRWAGGGRLRRRGLSAFVAACRLGGEPALGCGGRRPVQSRVAAGGRRGLVAGGMAGGRRLRPGSGGLFASDRRRLLSRRLLAPGGRRRGPRPRPFRSCATSGWPFNRDRPPRLGVTLGPPIRAALRTRVPTRRTHRTRTRGLRRGRAWRFLGRWAAVAPALAGRVDHDPPGGPGRGRGGRCRLGALGLRRERGRGRTRSIGAGRARGRRGRRRLPTPRTPRPVALLGRGGGRLAGGSLAAGGGRFGARAGAVAAGSPRRRLGSRAIGTRRRRGRRGGLGGVRRRGPAGRRRGGVGCLRIEVRRRVRPGWCGRFGAVWFETPWPGGGVGRLVHASSLVRPPGRAFGPAYRGGDASATGCPNLGRPHTAGRR